MALPIDLESKLNATDGDSSMAVARLVFRERLAENEQVAHLATHLTPTELDVILAQMARAAFIDHSGAAYYAFDVEFSHLESMLEVRARPALGSLADAGEAAPASLEPASPEL